MTIVAVVGRGALGRALAPALRRSGLRVRAFRARAPLPPAVGRAGVVVLAVRDEAIAAVAARLPVSPRQTVLHCAGAYAAAEVLGALRGRVGEIGTLHPLLSVAARGARFRGAVFAVEGRAARRLARRLGGCPVTLRRGAAPLYHAAAVLSAGHVAALLDAAIDAAIAAGLPRAAARRALCALARSAVDNVERLGTSRGLTGPVARGDAAVVARHLRALPAGARALYAALARRALRLSRAPARDRRRIKSLVESVRPKRRDR